MFAIGVLSALLMVPAIWNYLVGYAAGTAIAVIGLYIAFVLPVFLRLRLGDKFEHGAWSLGKHYKWIDIDLAHLGRRSSRSSSACRCSTTAFRGRRTSPGL